MEEKGGLVEFLWLSDPPAGRARFLSSPHFLPGKFHSVEFTSKWQEKIPKTSDVGNNPLTGETKHQTIHFVAHAGTPFLFVATFLLHHLARSFMVIRTIN